MGKGLVLIAIALALGGALGGLGGRVASEAAPVNPVGVRDLPGGPANGATPGSANYYVATSGSDTSGGGSAANPWGTIAYASTRIGPGAVVHVAPGTYVGSFHTNTSGTASAWITYVSDTKWGAKLVGAKGSTWGNYGAYVVVEGFDVTGPGLNGIYTEGDHTRIIGNHVHHVLTTTCNSIGGSGINLNAPNAEAIGNYVHDNGPYPTPCGYVHGIYFLQQGGKAFNNIAFRNAGYGIHIWHNASNLAITNNTLIDNLFGGVVIGASEGTVNDYTLVSNNIVYNNTRGISETGATGPHNVYANNLVYHNTLRDFSLQNNILPARTVSADPRFVDFTGDAGGNFHLQRNSPAIDAGSNRNAPDFDFDGVRRPQGKAWDIGAYEYVSPAAALLPRTAIANGAPREAYLKDRRTSVR